MKIINFTCTEKLQSLLDKSCSQTIRPAWKVEIVTEEVILEEYKEIAKTNEHIIISKPARFKVGEKVKLIWNQRSKYQWFCKKCGEGFSVHQIGGVDLDIEFSKIIGLNKYQVDFLKSPKIIISKLQDDYYKHFKKNKICVCSANNVMKNTFNKFLGTAEITEVFKIVLQYEFHLKNSPIFSGIDFRRNVKKIDFIDLSKRDGFKSAKDMFSWFDKKYDLSVPKQFWVYRFKWISTNT